jgi:hypothetical protein
MGISGIGKSCFARLDFIEFVKKQIKQHLPFAQPFLHHFCYLNIRTNLQNYNKDITSLNLFICYPVLKESFKYTSIWNEQQSRELYESLVLFRFRVTVV